MLGGENSVNKNSFDQSFWVRQSHGKPDVKLLENCHCFCISTAPLFDAECVTISCFPFISAGVNSDGVTCDKQQTAIYEMKCVLTRQTRAAVDLLHVAASFNFNMI